MVRWLVIGGVAVVALTIYALVDLFLTAKTRLRAFPLPVWAGIIVILPVIGPGLWLLIGKNKLSPPTAPSAPDDDLQFLGGIGESAEERIERLEQELRALDEEEDQGSDTAADESDDDTPPASPRE
jgi:hypothetical protein